MQNNNNNSLLYLLSIAIKNFKLLVITFVLSIVLGLVLAFTLPVFYKSTSIIYAYSPKAYDPRYLFSNVGNVDIFGSGDDADRVVTIGQSSEIATYIIMKYNLLNRYEIDQTDPLYWIDVTKKFQTNYSIKEDDRSAIVISMLDRNADTAALIVNDIVAKIDEINRRPLLESSKSQLDKYKVDLREKIVRIDSLMKSSGGKNLSQAEKDMYSIQQFNTTSDLKEAETRLDLLNQNFNTLYIVEKAAPVLKKAKPVRTFVLLGSVIGLTLSIFIYLVLYDQFKVYLKPMFAKV